MSKRACKRPPVVPSGPGAGLDCDDRNVSQVLAALSRVRDPMLRYLVTMLVDRLTQGIAELERGGAEKPVTPEELWAMGRPKPN